MPTHEQEARALIEANKRLREQNAGLTDGLEGVILVATLGWAAFYLMSLLAWMLWRLLT